MKRDVKAHFFNKLRKQFPTLRRLNASLSLFEIPGTNARIYVRYSKLHDATRTFYGLRQVDLRILEGHPSLICFLWDEQPQPLLLPYADFEEVFSSAKPADDGQIKVQVYPDAQATELFLAGVGRFNVEAYLGWNELNIFVQASSAKLAEPLTHHQVQSLLAEIGHAKGNDVWLPSSDRTAVTRSLVGNCSLQQALPSRFSSVQPILSEIDVVWLKRGSSDLVALFEVEHSTTVYSGLLRFNDVHLEAPSLRARFSVVANDTRRSLYIRQVNRPTFRRSGLSALCTFMEYGNVVDWHRRIRSGSL